MTDYLKFYGFGSAFRRPETANDIDLLAVHFSSEKRTYDFAIRCRRLLLSKVPMAHITVLSDPEEAYFDFIKTAKGIFLGVVRENHIDDDIIKLVTSLPQLNYPRRRDQASNRRQAT